MNKRRLSFSPLPCTQGRGAGGEGSAPASTASNSERMPMARPPKKISLARAQRQAPIPAEKRLWRALRDRALGGFKFRRQHPIGPYVVDFACVQCSLIV